MIPIENYLGLPLEEARRIASGEGEAFPDVIFTQAPSHGQGACREENSVERVIGFYRGCVVAARFNEFIRDEAEKE